VLTSDTDPLNIALADFQNYLAGWVVLSFSNLGKGMAPPILAGEIGIEVQASVKAGFKEGGDAIA